jgi:enoyl-CoA hydratase
MRESFMTASCFTLEIDGGVAHLQLSRPDEYNTMNPAFWDELPLAVDDLDRSGSVRALVVSSTGKHFTAGMDLAVFTGGSGAAGLGGTAATETGRRHASLWMTVQHLQDSFSCFERARFPVLAAIQGGCTGGGVDMVTAADCRYATENAFFCVQEINIGMTADVGTLQRLPKLVGEGIARQWAYTGERVPAQRAKEVGLVNEVYPDHESMVEAVLATAKVIASKSPLAIWGTKEMINFTRDHSTADSLRYMASWQSGMFQPGDMLEEFTAKSEGRPASFEDLPARPTR